jgi:hypothetical protein
VLFGVVDTLCVAPLHLHKVDAVLEDISLERHRAEKRGRERGRENCTNRHEALTGFCAASFISFGPVDVFLSRKAAQHAAVRVGQIKKKKNDNRCV